MLTIFTGGKHRSCDGLTRRDFIRAGALALGGGFALPELLRARAAASEAGNSLRERSVVFLWLGGQDGGSKDRDLPSVGAVYARLRGTTHPATGMPTHVLLTAPEIAQEFRYQKSWLADGATAGRLGGNYGPFHPDGEITGGKGDTPNYKPPPLLDNMQLKLPADHLDDRRLLLGQLD